LVNACHQRCSSGRTHGTRRVMPRKQNSFRRHFVQSRRFKTIFAGSVFKFPAVIPIAVQIAPAHIVHENENNIWTRTMGGFFCRKRLVGRGKKTRNGEAKSGFSGEIHGRENYAKRSPRATERLSARGNAFFCGETLTKSAKASS